MCYRSGVCTQLRVSNGPAVRFKISNCQQIPFDSHANRVQTFRRMSLSVHFTGLLMLDPLSRWSVEWYCRRHEISWPWQSPCSVSILPAAHLSKTKLGFTAPGCCSSPLDGWCGCLFAMMMALNWNLVPGVSNGREVVAEGRSQLSSILLPVVRP
jgi:hypothetical protein